MGIRGFISRALRYLTQSQTFPREGGEKRSLAKAAKHPKKHQKNDRKNLREIWFSLGSWRYFASLRDIDFLAALAETVLRLFHEERRESPGALLRDLGMFQPGLDDGQFHSVLVELLEILLKVRSQTGRIPEVNLDL
jgi:hypothetical protein